jgi:hypothetical protein
LRAHTRYRLSVSDEVLDLAGNPLDQSERAGFQAFRGAFRTR